MEALKFFHSTNILIHITAGTVALLLGTIALISRKGNKIHRKSGLLFLLALLFVIATGLIGVFVFGRNTFLLVITLLSAYQGFSGFRTIQTKSNKPALIDITMAIITLVSAFYFLYYFKKIGMMWSPVIIYSTVGWLVTIIAYDFLRYLIPSTQYKRTWFYEHIVKMIAAFGAITSAFTGTLFPDYQPYSQFLPSVLGMLLMVGFILYYKRQTFIQTANDTRTALPR
jgi:hypothetical protein